MLAVGGEESIETLAQVAANQISTSWIGQPASLIHLNAFINV